MLPYIGGQPQKKKPTLSIPQQLLKQWTQTKKELEIKSKLSNNKIPATITSDYHKICRLKQIPEFYSSYMLVTVEKLGQEKIAQSLSAEIREIINHRSHFHKINDLLDQRPNLIKNVIANIEICEGFQQMNAGKTIRPSYRTKINQVLREATSLQQIKSVQKNSIAELSSSICKLRKNIVSIYQQVKAWREYLWSISQKKNKLKIIFPHSGINCILVSLYDQQPIINSFLGKQFTINAENNPFVLLGKQAKRKNQFQSLLKEQLSKDSTNYDSLTAQILLEFPVKEDPNKKQKQQMQLNKQKEEQKIKWLKEIRQKSRNEKLQQKNKEKNEKAQENQLSKSKIRQKSLKKSKSLMDIESILLKHKQKRKKKEEAKNGQNTQQLAAAQQSDNTGSPKGKKEKKIISIYGSANKVKQNNGEPDQKIKLIMNQKAELEKELKQAKMKNKQFEKLIKKIEKGQPQKVNAKTHNRVQSKIQKSDTKVENNVSILNEQGKANFQNKVEAIYKSRHGRKISNKVQRNIDNSNISVQDLLNDKRSLEKQLKDQIRERKSLERQLKKSENQLDKKLENSRAQKNKLEEKIIELESKAENQKKQLEINQDILKRSKASIISVYMNQNLDKSKVAPVSNLYESKLVEQKQKRLSLQKQMKDIIKQKSKLQKAIQKSNEAMSKQKELIERKVEKYEETIQKLKQEHSELKTKKNSNVEQISRKKSESLRMYTTTPIKDKNEEKKENSLKKIVNHVQSANYFKLPPEIKKKNTKLKTIINEDDSEFQQKKQIVSTKHLNKVEIIQTKKTIQIIYEAARRSKKKKAQGQENEGKSTVNNEELERVKKQKESLMFQLERQQAKRQREEKAKQRKMLKEQGQVQKYKEIIQRQRERKYELQNKIKSLKKQLYDEFEERLKNEKLKFQEQKRQLLVMIQTEKGQKQLKQKYLNNQIKFLKEMEANQNQLIKLLQHEKRNRQEKEKELAAEIAKKQQLLQIIQIQQIKKGLQSEIRQELEKNYDGEEDEEQLDLEEKKIQLKQEIQEMNEERNAELEEIDEQNEKLKALITRIKDQQSKLISAIKQNIVEQEDEEQDEDLQMARSMLRQRQKELEQGRGYQSDDLERGTFGNISENQQAASDVQIGNLKKSNISARNKKLTQEKIDLEETQKIFQSRLKNQQEHEKRMKNEFKKIKQSPQYKGKQEVQNLIEMYLQNPHQYPPTKKRDYSPDQKKQIEGEVLKRSKMAGDFEKQLLSLKQVQQFVPTSDDDMMTSHLLNLKRAYEQRQSSALKQELFPTIKQDENYHDKDLSFESQQTPPPKTIREHVELHVKKFPVNKNKSKNFLSINKMRVAMLQEDRKQKQKQFIEDEAKRRAHEQVLKRKFRQIEEQRLKKSLQKKKLREQRQKLKNQALQKDKKKKKKVQIKDPKQKQQNKEDKTKEQKPEQLNKMNKTKKQDEKQKSEKKEEQQKLNQDQDQEQEQQNEQLSDEQKSNEQEDEKEDNENKQENEGEGQFNTENMEITNKHSSLDRQKKQLQQDVYKYQEEIRSFVSRQQKYDIYQQFVQSNQIENYIKNLITMSSEEIKGLNNNHTIFKDIPTYTSLLILIAKDKIKQVEVGIGIFHKEYEDSLYVCDYVLAHNMRNFLNLIFNFSRYMFNVDVFTNKIEFLFDLSKLEDQISIIHFIQFQEKCKRMGEVYVRVGADKTRKYALRRNLFESADKEFQSQGTGLRFQVGLEIHGDLIRQRGYGFTNTKHIQYFSTNALLSSYMKRNEQTLAIFRKNTEDNMRYRQLLLTTLMFQKKDVDVKNSEFRQLSIQQRLQRSKSLHSSFTIQDPTHSIQHLQLTLQHSLPPKTKRCTFQIDQQQTNYTILFPEQAITKIQSSNSSQRGIFLNILPKYKMLIIEATQFLTMNQVNPEINTFFYVKHFIKNIVDVGKEEYPRVFMPEVCFQSQVFLKDFSDQVKVGVFGREAVKFGRNNRFNNSLVYTPTHKDLVIKKPYIISILSGAIERVIEGTPLVATLANFLSINTDQNVQLLLRKYISYRTYYMMLKKAGSVIRYFSSINYYTVLGVREDSSFGEIKKSYLTKLKQSHPDSEQGDHNKFLELQKAFDTLSDVGRRKNYDKTIGIMNSTWEMQSFQTNPQFENQQIERVLNERNVQTAKFHSAYQNLTMKYREQLHRKQNNKYLFASMIVPTMGFTLFWLIWEFGETFLLNYQGANSYYHSVSKQGKDFSIIATQIR